MAYYPYSFPNNSFPNNQAIPYLVPNNFLAPQVSQAQAFQATQQKAPEAPSTITSSATKTSVAINYPRYEELVQSLENNKRDINVARSFKLKDVRQSRGVSMSQTVSDLLQTVPTTGIQSIDRNVTSVVSKAVSLKDLAFKTIPDFIRSTIQGGFYGTLGGVVVGLLGAFYMHANRGFKIAFGLSTAILGGLLGACFKIGHEMFRKTGQIKAIISN